MSKKSKSTDNPAPGNSERASEQRHFWFGSWIDDVELDNWLAHPDGEPARPGRLEQHLSAILPLPFPFADFMQASDSIASELKPGLPLFERLHAIAEKTTPAADVKNLLAAIAALLSRKAVRSKIKAELGCEQPGIISRHYPSRQFEAWHPIGCLTHVMPSNVFSAAALGMMEGLMAGNINIVKISSRDTEFAAVFAEELCKRDPGGRLHNYLAVVRLSSQDKKRISGLFEKSDAISVWGGENAVAAVRAAAPAGARVIAWGHKISFSYIAEDCLADPKCHDQALQGTALDVCGLDQQACSSPQTVFVETDSDPQAARSFAKSLAEGLAKVSPTVPAQEPDAAEQAEITTVLSVAQAEQALGLTEVFADPDGKWRVIYDARPGLRPSPLYRTIWVKPVQRKSITAILRPMRAWLQTCGLACQLPSLAPLSRALFAAGVTRICRPGEMVDSYIGAPHDGVYALQQLTRRVSLDGPESAQGVGSLAEFEPMRQPSAIEGPILHKHEFQELAATVQKPDIVVRSGGSSGKTVYSLFSWADYHEQMLWTAHGMVAAGLEPERDRVMNCYAAGYLYGSLISFWTILEYLRVPQLPMGLIDDYAHIAEVIFQNKVNTLVGVPSHLLGLFNSQKEKLAGKVEKIFYGGEKLARAQYAFLTGPCGVSIVRSAVYGSNDAGPMGYQCAYCTGGRHHLLSALTKLEIVDMDEDKPVPPGVTGRMLLTPIVREYPVVRRYEIGDSGCWVSEPCPCGRADPLFELQGRIGDVFKAGGPFYNYRRFVDILDNELGYGGPVQAHILEQGHMTVLELWVAASAGLDLAAAEKTLCEHYPEISQNKDMGFAFDFRLRAVEEREFERNPASGKLRPVCDHR